MPDPRYCPFYWTVKGVHCNHQKETNMNGRKRRSIKMECAVIVMAVMDLVPIVIGVVSAAVREGKKRAEPQKAD